MFTPCLFSELDTTTFVLSVSDNQGRFQIRKNEMDKTLFLCRDAGCWKTEDALATLQTVLKWSGTYLKPSVFVHLTDYTEYPVEYAMQCALHHLPPMWGIQKT